MPSNLFQLKLIKNALLRLNQKYNIELHIATNLMYFRFLGKYGLTSAKKEVERIFENSIAHEWTKETITDLVRQSDIAIIPIDSRYSLNKFKPENKILFFWRMGIPVVVSDIPSYIRTMRNADLDFVCKDEVDWYKKIESLILDSSMRQATATAGKQYADRISNTKVITKEWDNVFESIGISSSSS